MLFFFLTVLLDQKLSGLMTSNRTSRPQTHAIGLSHYPQNDVANQQMQQCWQLP